MTDKFHTQCHRQLMEEKMTDKFPDVIYLQYHEADDIYFDGQITWCQDKINDADVQYIRTDVARGAYRQEMKAEIVKWLQDHPLAGLSQRQWAKKIDKEF